MFDEVITGMARAKRGAGRRYQPLIFICCDKSVIEMQLLERESEHASKCSNRKSACVLLGFAAVVSSIWQGRHYKTMENTAS